MARVELIEGVSAEMDIEEEGLFWSDLMVVLKSYGFAAEEDADDRYDDLKGIG